MKSKVLKKRKLLQDLGIDYDFTLDHGDDTIDLTVLQQEAKEKGKKQKTSKPSVEKREKSKRIAKRV